MTTTDRNGALHAGDGRYAEKSASAPGPGASLAPQPNRDPLAVTYDESGRPSNQRDGACICDYNPETTDGPQEDCPFHGRRYAEWIERGDDLADRLAAAEAKLAEVEKLAARWKREGARIRYASDLTGILTPPPSPDATSDPFDEDEDTNWCISCGQPPHLPAPAKCLARAAHVGYVPGERFARR